MKIILLNGKRMINKKETHLYIKRKLELPDYYGKNLDALWDLLTIMSDPINIIILNGEYITENLGEYGNSLISVFEDVAKTNDRVIINIVDFKKKF